MTRSIRRTFAVFSIPVALLTALWVFTGTGGRLLGRSALHGASEGATGNQTNGKPGHGHQRKPNGDDPSAKETGADDRVDPRNPAEWTTLGISVVIVAGLIGVAVYEHVARMEPAGTRVSVQVDVAAAEQRDGLFYVPYTVANTGGQPAENVAVVFEVKRGEEIVEESNTEIPFLPNSGSATGELVTALDPAAHAIEARVASLQLP